METIERSLKCFVMLVALFFRWLLLAVVLLICWLLEMAACGSSKSKTETNLPPKEN